MEGERGRSAGVDVWIYSREVLEDVDRLAKMRSSSVTRESGSAVGATMEGGSTADVVRELRRVCVRGELLLRMRRVSGGGGRDS